MKISMKDYMDNMIFKYSVIKSSLNNFFCEDSDSSNKIQLLNSVMLSILRNVSKKNIKVNSTCWNTRCLGIKGSWCWKYVHVLLTVKDRKEEKSVPSSYLESLASTFSKMTTN